MPPRPLYNIRVRDMGEELGPLQMPICVVGIPCADRNPKKVSLMSVRMETRMQSSPSLRSTRSIGVIPVLRGVLCKMFCPHCSVCIVCSVREFFKSRPQYCANTPLFDHTFVGSSPSKILPMNLNLESKSSLELRNVHKNLTPRPPGGQLSA